MVSWLLLQSGKVVSGAWKKSGTGYIKQNRNKTVSFPFLVSLKTFCLQLRPFRFSSHIFCSSLHFSRQHLSYVVYCLLHFPSFCLFCIICFRTYSSLPWWRRRHISTKRLYLSTKLHDVTYRQFIIFVYFFSAWPIPAGPTLGQRCAVRRVSGTFSGRWGEIEKWSNG